MLYLVCVDFEIVEMKVQKMAFDAPTLCSIRVVQLLQGHYYLFLFCHVCSLKFSEKNLSWTVPVQDFITSHSLIKIGELCWSLLVVGCWRGGGGVGYCGWISVILGHSRFLLILSSLFPPRIFMQICKFADTKHTC